MDAFDIIWLVVCIGLPVLSGLFSSGKKKPAKGSPRPQAGSGRGLADVLKDIVLEMTDADTADSVGDEPAADVAHTLVEGNQGSETMRVPVEKARLEKTPGVLPASAYSIRQHSSVPVAPERIDDSEIRADADAHTVEKPRKRNDKERIDPEKMVIYTAIMNPKFKEY